MQKSSDARGGNASASKVARGLALHQKGDLVGAEKMYAEALRIDSRNVDALHFSGVLAHQRGQNDLAVERISAALHENPGFLAALNNLALVYRAQGDHQGVIKTYKRLISLQPANEGPVLNLGAFLIDSGSFDDAVHLFTESRRKAPDSVGFTFALAVALHQGGNRSGCIEFYREVLERDPSRADAYLNLLVVLKDLGRFLEAEKLAGEAIDRFPEHAFLQFNAAQAFMSVGRLSEAADCFKKSLSLEPGFTKAKIGLGDVLASMSDRVGAEAAYREALELDPNSPIASNNLGALLLNSASFSDAESCFQHAIKANPAYAEAYSNLCSSQREQGKLEEALANGKRAVELVRNAAGLNNLGMVLHAVGDYSAALSVLEEALDLDAHSGAVNSNLARVLLELRQYELSEEHARRAQKDESTEPGALLLLASISRFKGLYREAEKYYSRLLSLEPDNLSALCGRAGLYQMLDDFSAAQDDYQSALALDGVSESVRFALADVRRVLGDREGAVDAFESGLESVWEEPSILLGETEPQPASDCRVVALVGFGRSGTMFVHGLFDSHPQVMTLPGVYFKGFFSRNVRESLAVDYERVDWRQRLARRVCRDFSVLFDARSPNPVPGNPVAQPCFVGIQTGLDRMGDDRSESLAVDQQEFSRQLVKELCKYERVGHGRLFELVHRAYQVAIGCKSDLGTIFFHIHNPGTVEIASLCRAFPNTKLLQVVRDPVRSLESWIASSWPQPSGSSETNIDNEAVGVAYAEIALRFRDLFTQMSWYPELDIPKLALRLEDVKSKPKETLSNIANWIGIDWSESFLKSTFAGHEYWGPESRLNPGLRGFALPDRKGSSNSIFSESDVHLMEALFEPFRVHHGYTDHRTFNSDSFAEVVERVKEPFDFEKMLVAEALLGQEDLLGRPAFVVIRSTFEHYVRRVCANGQIPDLLPTQ